MIIAIFIFSFTFISCREKHKVELLPNDEIYTCPSHVHVIDNHPAKCPNDGQELLKRRITEEQRKRLKDGDYERAKE